MVTGQVVPLGSSLRAAVELTILGNGQSELRAFATIDTGFTDDLSLPAGAISALSLRRIGTVDVELGDGDLSVFNTYEATIVWQGLLRAVQVHESEGLPLIGMGLLQGNNLQIQAIHGGDVSITPLS